MKFLACSLVFFMSFWLGMHNAIAEPALDAIKVTQVGQPEQTFSVSIQVMLFMTMLTLLPAIAIMMTSFTRIIIVLAILRQALGTGQTPTNQILIGLTLFLTFFIMAPIFNQASEVALNPYMAEEISAKQAFDKAIEPFKRFMLAQTRDQDIVLFSGIAGEDSVQTASEISMRILMPAFITSELKTAFQIGFLIFIPFLIIDLVVASVLMSMGMMMLSPMIISLPFKIMLFVLVDGWVLVIGSLASSFSL